MTTIPSFALALRAGAVSALVLLAALPAAAFVPPSSGGVREKEMKLAELHVANRYVPPSKAPAAMRAGLSGELARLGVAPENGFYDLRGGRWGTLILGRPLVPGTGKGNELRWAALGMQPPAAPGDLERAVWAQLVRLLDDNRAALRIETAELAAPRITVLANGNIVQVYANRVVGGVAVRNSSLVAVVNHGNLVTLGTRNWGTLSPLQPLVSLASAQARVAQHAAPYTPAGLWRKPHLLYLPIAEGLDATDSVVGSGYAYRLAWVVSPRIAGDNGSWEGLVDAVSGELVAFTDTNLYASRGAFGGVYPVSNDGAAPGGTEEIGYPMPYADLSTGTGVRYTSSGGLAGCAFGGISTTLNGKFVRMSDACGPISEMAVTGHIDLGAGPGTDCTVPAGATSLGNTHASRSGFYELNRLREMAAGWLGPDRWLDDQLTSNMNIDDTCNAFWNGSTVNFYRSGGGCRNTGEIAAIFDHEWGHGMDDNDADGAISAPGEAIADIYAMLRLHVSCIGRGFDALDAPCGGYGDDCDTCSGVRDIDYANHTSGLPHDIGWILTPTIAPGGGCVGVIGTQQGPCAQETHCEGMVPAEVGYDLAKRDFAGAPYGYSANTAFEVATRIIYTGAGLIGNWYQCDIAQGTGDGCNADGGYLNLLAADDDDGSLTNGTPHMAGIYAAFNRHGIACGSPTVADSGCASAPTAAPVVVGAGLDQGVSLAWDAVPGALEYWIFRTEGVFGCDFGKVRVGKTSGTSYIDEGLLNGFAYAYGVMPVGANDTCMGPMSACVTLAPIAGPNLLLLDGTGTATPTSGDGDGFIDNCETAAITFEAQNTGLGNLTNVRVVAITSPTHPAVSVTTTLPLTISPSLGECVAVTGSFDIAASGLVYDDTLQLEVEVTSDELAAVGITRTIVLSFDATESDLGPVETVEFDFENGYQDWDVVSGTFDLATTGGGAETTATYLASSTALEDQCDNVRSPYVLLSNTSTLSLFNQFTIEPITDDWYDRANAGIFDPQTNRRTNVAPDGGRAYIATGTHGVCVTGNQPGWAGPGPGWLESTWSPTALEATTFAGRLVKLDIGYGTDPLASGVGFWFDQVSITGARKQVPDVQPDACCGGIPFGDLDVDLDIDATDLVIMANYLVGNVAQGTPPFTAPLSAADLDVSGTVEAVDLVILANYLVGNISCLPV